MGQHACLHSPQQCRLLRHARCISAVIPENLMPLSSCRRIPFVSAVATLLLILNVSSLANSQQMPGPDQFSGMKWRLLGPFRAGRVTAVAGVPGDPTTYYFGTPGGGVWKSTNGGR